MEKRRCVVLDTEVLPLVISLECCEQEEIMRNFTSSNYPVLFGEGMVIAIGESKSQIEMISVR